MKIVAFLQNQWFKNPAAIKAQIEEAPARHPHKFKTYADAREWYLAAYLFFGCTTGRRLRAAFGEELCDKIIWEEQSPEIGGKASAAFPPDFAHIRGVLERHSPTHVIALGSLASDALTKILIDDNPPWNLICGPHPAARFPDIVARLKGILAQLPGEQPQGDGKALQENNPSV